MKKFLLLCGLFAMATVAAYAQETKRVAILEVVDKENKLTYSQKLLLRSNMSRAVANTPGYEAYDRTDIDAILGEQDFQRTGLVSDSEIRKLGEMAGVSLILVTEGALTTDNKIIVSVKLLNVETARVEMADYATMELSTEDIQRGCKSLVNRLFGNTAINDIDMIKKVNNNEYKINNQTMDRIIYEKFIQQNCPEAWKKHCQAKKYITTGWCLFSVGLFATTLASINGGIQLSNGGGSGWGAVIAAGVVGGVGAASLITSATLLGIGYNKRNNTYRIYNNDCTSSRHTPLSLNIKADQNGLGLALHF